jgi:hypothetical protein
VALSVTAQNVKTVVGVAVSASLLVPAVNAGMLFADATLVDYYFSLACLSSSATLKTWQNCCTYADDTEMPGTSCPQVQYAEFCCATTIDDAGTLAMKGGISTLTVVVNAVCICVFASIMFAIKQIRPGREALFFTVLIPQTRVFNKLWHKFASDERALHSWRDNFREEVGEQVDVLMRMFGAGRGEEQPSKTMGPRARSAGNPYLEWEEEDEP